MPVADRTQAVEIGLGRHQHAGRAGHRLDDHAGDGAGIVQRDQVLQRIGKLRAVNRLAATEGIASRIMRMRQVIHARQHRAGEGLAVGDDAAHRYTAKAHAVIGALAADETETLRLAARPVKSQRDLERGIHRFGTGVGEEDIGEVVRRQRRELVRETEHAAMTHVETHGEVELAHLLAHRLDDARMTVTGVAAPEPGDRVEDLPPVTGGVVHPGSGFEQQRVLLEITVGRERHPVGLQIGHRRRRPGRPGLAG